MIAHVIAQMSADSAQISDFSDDGYKITKRLKSFVDCSYC